MYRVISLISFFLLAFVTIVSAYTITTLGSPVSAWPGSINDNGVIVGGSDSHASLYSNATGAQDLGTLGGTWSGAYGINNNGSVVGESATTIGENYEENHAHAFLYNSTTGMQDLGTLGGTWSGAYGINDSGSVVGASSTGISGTGYDHAFLYSSTTGMQDLGTLGGTWSEASGINDGGFVVGTSTSNISGEDYDRAFLYSSTTGMQDLGTLGGTWSQASAINDGGFVVGTSAMSAYDYHAFLYDSTSEMQDLGTLGGTWSEALGINDDGFVVGTSTRGITSEDDDRAFLYSPTLGIQDLNDILNNEHWELREAVDINNQGQIIGLGSLDGVDHAFLMTPEAGDFMPDPTPEPRSYALLTGWGDKGTASMKEYLLGAGWNERDIGVLPETVGLQAEFISNIENALNPGDDFLFYYKGHGGSYKPVFDGPNLVYDETHQGETHETGTFFEHGKLYAYASDEAIIYGEGNNKTVIYDDDLTQMFNDEKWNSINKTFILDSCFSGGFEGGNDIDNGGDLDILPRTTLIYSSLEDQTTPASKNIFGEYTTILTNFILLEGLKELQAADGDRYVTIQELFDWWDNYGSKRGTILEKLKLITWNNILDVESPSGPVPDDFNILDYLDSAGYYTNQNQEYLNSRGFLSPAPEPVPEPATFILLGSGLAGLAFYRRKRK